MLSEKDIRNMSNKVFKTYYEKVTESNNLEEEDKELLNEIAEDKGVEIDNNFLSY